MDKATIIGLTASIFSAVSMIPQLVKIIKEKKSGSVSLLMPLILLAGLGIWIWYGFIKEDWIIIGSNTFSVVVNALILFFSLKYRHKEGK